MKKRWYEPCQRFFCSRLQIGGCDLPDVGGVEVLGVRALGIVVAAADRLGDLRKDLVLPVEHAALQREGILRDPGHAVFHRLGQTKTCQRGLVHVPARQGAEDPVDLPVRRAQRGRDGERAGLVQQRLVIDDRLDFQSHIADNLRYNSIAICIVNVNKDYAGDNYAFMVADKNVKFHRISKLDFMGEHYHKDGTATYMAEITYRKNDLNDKASDEELTQKVIEGLETIGFIDSKEDVNFTDLKRFEYAYVIYDLKHRQNMDAIKEYFTKQGIYLNGRFGSFEYLNMDAIIRQSKQLAECIK